MKKAEREYTVFSSKNSYLCLLDEEYEEFEPIDIEVLLEDIRAKAGDRIRITVEIIENDEKIKS